MDGLNVQYVPARTTGGSGTGTVTSVAVTAPGLVVTGSPITVSGTINLAGARNLALYGRF